MINSFTAEDSNSNPLSDVQPGDAITFNFSVTGDSYDYIDNIGPVRLTPGGGGMNIGSISITPSTTQEYTLYSTNASGQAYSTIAIIMPTAPMAAPVFIPPSGEYPAATKVAILAPTETSTNYCISNCSGNGVYTTATIYYTTNGSTPTTSSSVFSDAETANGGGNGAGDISVTPPETVEAIIVTQIDGTPYTSTVGTAVYTTGAAAAATPTFSPVAGSYNTSQSVTISSTTPSSTIYYTTDTTLPTYPISGTTQLYSGPITVSSSENIEAIAVASGDATSAVGSAGYTFNPAAPTFDPIAGSYTGAQWVTISDATVGATIYYTVTSGSVGTTPTTSSRFTPERFPLLRPALSMRLPFPPAMQARCQQRNIPLRQQPAYL